MRDLSTIRVFLVGPGRLGCSLGVALAQSTSHSLMGVAYHSAQGKDRCRRWLPGISSSSVAEARGVGEADLVLIAVLDGEIRNTARLLQPHLGPHQVLLHTSGLLSSRVFDGLEITARVGSIHPLQTFADPGQSAPLLEGCTMACEGDAEAVAAARSLARDLKAHPVVVPADMKPLYHAAAVMASNYLVTITGMAVRLLGAAGIDPTEAIRMLRPLQLGTLTNLASQGIPRALTGPILRGDVETVRAHIEGIRQSAPEILEIYRQLGQHTLSMAASLLKSPEALKALEALLNDPGLRSPSPV